ncbi:hypothetical protein GQ53DRAFT_230220 [Thozetella sp. PMI_491]|nr:hypothetical protein GQ53DRAFT_230220 [Thozetella sp. PMI_491]
MTSSNLLNALPRRAALAVLPTALKPMLARAKLPLFSVAALRCVAKAARPGPWPWVGSSRTFTSTAATRQTQTNPKAAHPSRIRRPGSPRPVILIGGGCFIAGLVLYTLLSERSDPISNSPSLLGRVLLDKPLNERSFEPFTIVSREQVSPTSFIIDVQPTTSLQYDPSGFVATHLLRGVHRNMATVAKAWEHGLWHIEVKHPLIQVAREYTPLAPREGQEAYDLARGSLRFLIRTVDGGEVSHYLAGLGVGDEIELRGPHLGFEVQERLGSAGHLVFLAGGTGIAPALQAARAVLDGSSRDGSADSGQVVRNPIVSIIWANRRSSDCQGCNAISSSFTMLAEKGSNAIVAQLAEMKRRHGNRLEVLCTVDEESNFINAALITAAAIKESRPPSRADHQGPVAGCRYHSVALLVASDGRDSGDGPCTCRGSDGKLQAGKKLMMVSGPDGFVAALAGPKRWAEGKERQGPVGGVLGDIFKRNPRAWADWMVLKL